MGTPGGLLSWTSLSSKLDCDQNAQTEGWIRIPFEEVTGLRRFGHVDVRCLGKKAVIRVRPVEGARAAAVVSPGDFKKLDGTVGACLQARRPSFRETLQPYPLELLLILTTFVSALLLGLDALSPAESREASERRALSNAVAPFRSTVADLERRPLQARAQAAGAHASVIRVQRELRAAAAEVRKVPGANRRDTTGGGVRALRAAMKASIRETERVKQLQAALNVNVQAIARGIRQLSPVVRPPRARPKPRDWMKLIGEVAAVVAAFLALLSGALRVVTGKSG